MQWQAVRDHFPSQWLLVEAIKAHSDGNKRILDDIAVIDIFADSLSALKGQSQLRRQWPARELLVLHTDKEMLDITELRWLGLRPRS